MRQTISAFLLAAVTTCATPSLAQQAQADRVEHFDLRIENGRLTDSRSVIAVRRSDRVEITWHVDRQTALHLHGYDIALNVAPDKPEAMTFVARATGRFPIEIHASPGEGRSASHHAVLIYLEVHPR